MASNDYVSFYRKDLNEMIDQITLEEIKKGTEELSDTCPLQNYLAGIFTIVDALKEKLNEEEE